MSAAPSPGGPTPLLGVTLRRAVVSGRFYLVYGAGLSTLLGIILARTSVDSFETSYPLFLPIFGTIGSMGGIVVFTADRTKGVLEYLLAYGVTPRQLFGNILLTNLTTVTIILGISVPASVGALAVGGHPIPRTLLLTLAVYGIPMTYACSGFASIVGMYWTALSSPRQMMNSPIGLIPFVGILPSLATLGVVVGVGVHGGLTPALVLVVFAGATACVAIVVGGLLALIDRFLRRERLLSPA